MTALPRVQLALNVSDVDAAVDFYTQLFGAEPHKQRPGYANFALESPSAQARPHRERRGRGQPQPPRRRGRRRPRSPRRAPHRPVRACRARRGRRRLLPRDAGQGVGRRPRRPLLGVLHDHRRQPRPLAADGRRRLGRRRLVLLTPADRASVVGRRRALKMTRRSDHRRRGATASTSATPSSSRVIPHRASRATSPPVCGSSTRLRFGVRDVGLSGLGRRRGAAADLDGHRGLVDSRRPGRRSGT